MKKRISLLLLTVLLLTTMMFAPVVSAGFPLAEGKTIEAESAILVYLGTTPAEDVVIFEKDADTKRSPAAMVRLMVGSVAMKLIREKNINIDTATGTYTLECNEVISDTGLGVVNMKIGETWTIRDLLSMSIIHTAADACVTLAVELAGSHAAFVSEMNLLAAEIGCQNTNFANVTGLDSLSQYTTARDMVIIMRHVMDYAQLTEMMKNEKYTGKDVNTGTERTYLNINDMIRPGASSYYAPVQFGRTGVSGATGACLTAVAQDSGYRYMSVVMGCPSQGGAHYNDTKTLLSWAFNGFSYRSLLTRNEPMGTLNVNLSWDKDKIILVPEKGISAIVPNELDNSSIHPKIIIEETEVNAPINKGDVYGRVELYIGVDQKIGEDNLVAAESVPRNEMLSTWHKIKGILTSPWLYITIGGLILLIAAYAVYVVIHNRNKRRGKKIGF